MRVLFALCSAVMLTTFAPASLYVPPPVPAESFVSFAAVPLNPDDSSQRSVGSLRLLGSWQLQSQDPRFGGVSAISIEGAKVTAVSDGGFVLNFTIFNGKTSVPLEVLRLDGGPGRWSKRSRDLEALTIAGDQAWLSLEFGKAVWRYDKRNWAGQSGALPPAMTQWPRNGGAEALLRLDDGRFLVFSERHEIEDGMAEALLFAGDPAVEGTEAKAFKYRGPEGYRVTDAAMLSNGRLILLHRKLSFVQGFTTKISIAELAEIKENSVLASIEIATIEPPLAAANFEALAITRENGRDTVWVASDDNFSPSSRTLLLKFQLAA